MNWGIGGNKTKGKWLTGKIKFKIETSSEVVVEHFQRNGNQGLAVVVHIHMLRLACLHDSSHSRLWSSFAWCSVQTL